MNAASECPLNGPVFRKCPGCGYSLRGLPARHRCPECGLGFDERCELYRVANPRQVLVLSLMIFAGGWASIRNIPHLANLSGASAWDLVGAFAGVLWIVFVVLGVVFFIRRYRRGFEVALTRDGLIVRLPGFNDELIPWRDISGAEVDESRPSRGTHVAIVILEPKKKRTPIGGTARVFPTRDDVERFVSEINARVATASNASSPHVRLEDDDQSQSS